MKKIICFLSLTTIAFGAIQAHAQQVGTIGVGDITFGAEARKQAQVTERVHTAINVDLNNALLKTRKFTVLDYDQLNARLDEQSRTLNDYYEKKYSGNALIQAGLDYILRANVTKLDTYNKTLGNSAGEVGSVKIDFELIGVGDATQGFSSSVATEFVNNSGGAQNVLNGAIEQAVDHLVNQVVSRLFPVRVMKIADSGVVTLNYGEGLLDVGDTILVYPIDTDIIIDESGKVAGEAVATLKVISTKRKFAEAQALNGFDALEKGQNGQLLLTGS